MLTIIIDHFYTYFFVQMIYLRLSQDEEVCFKV